MFGQLNKEYVYAQGRGELFNRGSFYFREKQWTEQEMADISFSIASKAIFYYFPDMENQLFSIIDWSTFLKLFKKYSRF